MYFFQLDTDGIPRIYKQQAIHKDINKEDTIFDMREESDGSIRLLDFIPMLIDLQQNSSVYFIDEIDRSMHPMLSSLAEYKPREDIRKGYLQGRYGAIPFFAPVKNLNWK